MNTPMGDAQFLRLINEAKSIHVTRTSCIHWRTLCVVAKSLKGIDKSTYDLVLYSNGVETYLDEVSFLQIITAFYTKEKFDSNSQITLINYDPKNIDLFTKSFMNVNTSLRDPKIMKIMSTMSSENSECTSFGDIDQLDTNYDSYENID